MNRKNLFKLALIVITTLGFAITIYAEMSKPQPEPLFMSNFRRVSVDLCASSFTWGNGHQLIYAMMHESGRRLYIHDLETGKTIFLSKGTSPWFVKSRDHDTIYFLKSTGYSDDKELWQYQIFSNTEGESKVSHAIVRVSRDIYPSPDDVRTFAYRYSCCMAEGGFEQIRLTTVQGYDRIEFETKVLYSRPLGGPLPSIVGWIDNERLVCFIGEEPYLLSTTSGLTIFPKHELSREKLTKFPDKSSGTLSKGLGKFDKITIPSSNFTPDGHSYIVYSKERNSLIQRSLDGKEVFSTALPKAIEYYSYQGEHPKFSRDGRHICFIGLVTTGDGHKRLTLWIADVGSMKNDFHKK